MMPGVLWNNAYPIIIVYLPIMQQTEIKEIITESLNLLKEKIVVALESNDHETVDGTISDLAESMSNMVTQLEELAFEAGRLQEDDETFVFDDFDDFQNS